MEKDLMFSKESESLRINGSRIQPFVFAYIDFEPGDGTRYRAFFHERSTHDFMIGIGTEAGTWGLVSSDEMQYQVENYIQSETLEQWAHSGQARYLAEKLNNKDINVWTLRALVYAWYLVRKDYYV
jgi:hypothetical protein